MGRNDISFNKNQRLLNHYCNKLLFLAIMANYGTSSHNF